jgi:hypothetical protein
MTTEFVLDTWTDGPRLTALDLGPTPHGWHTVGVLPSILVRFIREADALDPNGVWSGCEVVVDEDGAVLLDEVNVWEHRLPVLDADTVEAAGGDPSLRETGGEIYVGFGEWTFVPVATVESWEV